jgi:RHS repeat-associated protein
MQYDNSTSERYYYLHDRLGSVRLMIGEDGEVVNCYTYDPWGKTIGSETRETISNDYRFAGYFWDDEIRMYYCINRYYDPELMRFIGKDIVGGKYEEPLGLHRYLYCINDPLNKIDPLGLLYEVPGAADSDYSEGETQTVLNMAVDVIGISRIAGPFEAFIWSWIYKKGPGGMFDYGNAGTKFTFMRYGAKLSGSEFGNYLAGYAAFRNYGRYGEWFTRLFGNKYERDKTGNLDDPGSIFYITAGALHGLQDRGDRGWRTQINKTRLTSRFYEDMYNYWVSDVEGHDNACDYAYKFFHRENSHE